MNLLDWSCPIAEVLARISSGMAELNSFKETVAARAQSD